MLCPKCGQIMGEMICGSCGYDGSRDYLRFPTLFHDIPEAAGKPASAEQALAQKAQYDAASSLEEAADSPETFKAAALLFEQLARQGFRDSAERARKCREKAEELQAAKPSNDPEPVPPEKESEGIPEQRGGKNAGKKKGLLAVVLGFAAVAVLALIIWKAASGPESKLQASPENAGISLSGTAAPSSAPVSAPTAMAPTAPTPEPTPDLADRFSYTLHSNGSITITAFKGIEAVISIPSSIDGHSVQKIGDNVFYNGYWLTGVSIPNTIISIGDYTFAFCNKLTSVSIPNSVTSIGNSAFAYCTKLTSVSIPNSVTSIGNSAFSGCGGLTGVSIPESVTKIGYSAFSGCSGLTSVSIPNSVTSIEGAGVRFLQQAHQRDHPRTCGED